MPDGAAPGRHSLFGAQPRRGAIFVLTQVPSMNTSRFESIRA